MENNNNITNDAISKKKCKCCGKLLDITEFKQLGKLGYEPVCQNCKNIVSKGNTLASYTIQQLLRELRSRGVKGKFTYTRVETIEL